MRPPYTGCGAAGSATCCLQRHCAGQNRCGARDVTTEEATGSVGKSAQELADARRQYYAQNRERILEKRREHYRKHKERLLEYSRDYYQDHKDQIRSKSKRWYDENKNRKSEYWKQYYERHREAVLNRNRQRYLARKAAQAAQSAKTGQPTTQSAALN